MGPSVGMSAVPFPTSTITSIITHGPGSMHPSIRKYPSSTIFLSRYRASDVWNTLLWPFSFSSSNIVPVSVVTVPVQALCTCYHAIVPLLYLYSHYVPVTMLLYLYSHFVPLSVVIVLVMYLLHCYSTSRVILYNLV